MTWVGEGRKETEDLQKDGAVYARMMRAELMVMTSLWLRAKGR